MLLRTSRIVFCTLLLLLVSSTVSTAQTSQSSSDDIHPATSEQIRQWNSHLQYRMGVPHDTLVAMIRTPATWYVMPHTHWDKEWGWTMETLYCALKSVQFPFVICGVPRSGLCCLSSVARTRRA